MVAQNVFRMEFSLHSQISIAFHGICPPFFILTWLQPYCRRTFFHSAYCSLSNPTFFRSVSCRRTMIPGKIFTSFAKFQEIVNVNDFRLPIRLRELLQAPLCFLRSFCFARIRLDPLGGQVLHHDCISMSVSRFTTFTENFVICCNQVTQFFLHEVRLRQCVFCTEPLWFWSSGRSRNFGLSGSEYKHSVYPNPHFSKALKIIHEKNLRVSLCFQELSHPQDSLWILAAIPVCQSPLLIGVGSKEASWEELACESLWSGTLSSTRFSLNSCPFRYVGMKQVFPYLLVIHIFIWFWVFGWLGQQVSLFLPFNRFTWRSNGTGIYPTQVSPCLSSHTVAWHSWRCHGWWGRRAWWRRRMINVLPWRCHWCWRRKAWGKTRW